MRTKIVIVAVAIVILMIGSVVYYVQMFRPTTLQAGPSEASLVPPLIIATATPDSSALDEQMMRLVVGDITGSGLGISTKLLVGDSDSVIYGKLYYGLEPGGYNAWDMGYSGMQGTADRLADPSTLLVRAVSRYANGSFNYAGYNNSQYDSLYYQQLGTLDLQKRKFLVDWMTQNYAENVVRLTVGFEVVNVAINRGRVSGAVSYGSEGMGNIWTYLNASSLVGADAFNVAVITAGEGDVVPASFNIFTYTLRTNGLQAMILNGVYDDLLKTQPDGSVAPALAVGWRVVNNTNIIVQLRGDAKWSDGQLVTADDVKFTFDYLAKTGQPAILQPYISSIARVVALNSTTVQFLLKQPFAPFITNTLTQIPILPQHVWDGLMEKQGVKNPSDVKLTQDLFIGSGPWKLTTWNYGSEVIFERNPYYSPQPHYKNIRFVYFTSDSVAFTALEQGQVDTIPSGDTLTTLQTQEVGGYPNLQVTAIPTGTVLDLHFNMRRLPSADLAFRLALAHAINYDNIVNVVFGGNLVRGVGVIAPVSKSWVDVPLFVQAMKSIFSYNVTAAKKILTDAGYQWDSQGHLHYPETLLSKGLAAIENDNYKFTVPMSKVISTISPQAAGITPQYIPYPPVNIETQTTTINETEKQPKTTTIES